MAEWVFAGLTPPKRNHDLAALVQAYYKGVVPLTGTATPRP